MDDQGILWYAKLDISGEPQLSKVWAWPKAKTWAVSGTERVLGWSNYVGQVLRRDDPRLFNNLKAALAYLTERADAHFIEMEAKYHLAGRVWAALDWAHTDPAGPNMEELARKLKEIGNE